MFRPSRKRGQGSGDHPVLEGRPPRGGALLGLVGMGSSHGWLAWVGIGVLVVGLLLRFLPGGE